MYQDTIKKLNIKLTLAIFLRTFIIILSLSLNISIHHKQIENNAITESKAHFNNNQAFRFWATKHGGVHISTTQLIQPNSHLSHSPYRDIEKPDGTHLTPMKPAYIIGQVNRGTEIKVILSSGYNDVEIITELSDKGLSGCIQKPYRFNGLKSILSNIMYPEKDDLV